MVKALIILPSTSKYSPARIGSFLWNGDYNCHLWEGRPLDMDEFNTVSKRIFFERRDDIEEFDLPPYVQLVRIAQTEAEKVPARPVLPIHSQSPQRTSVPKLTLPDLASL